MDKKITPEKTHIVLSVQKSAGHMKIATMDMKNMERGGYNPYLIDLILLTNTVYKELRIKWKKDPKHSITELNNAFKFEVSEAIQKRLAASPEEILAFASGKYLNTYEVFKIKYKPFLKEKGGIIIKNYKSSKKGNRKITGELTDMDRILFLLGMRDLFMHLQIPPTVFSKILQGDPSSFINNAQIEKANTIYEREIREKGGRYEKKAQKQKKHKSKKKRAKEKA